MTNLDFSAYKFKQLIDGQWCDASNGNTWDLINPGTEEVLLKVPFGNATDCREAVAAAKKAFPEWSSKTPYSPQFKAFVSLMA